MEGLTTYLECVGTCGVAYKHSTCVKKICEQ